MTKFHHALTDATLRAAKPQETAYKLADGGGLYALVLPTGTVCWRYNYRINGTAKTLAIGTYPVMPLKVAREQHQKAALTVQLGGDPVAEKKETKEEKKRQATFREVAQEYLTNKVPEDKRAGKTSDRDLRMVRYLNEAFGDLPILDLRLKHLSDLLQKYEEAGKFETRIRIQGAAVAIMGYAAGRGYLNDQPNPFVGVNYAASFTSPANEPRPAITKPEAFGHMLRKVHHFEGREGNLTGMALELLALTFVRPGDIAKARWAHFDLDETVKWTVPPDEAKMRTLRKQNKSPRAGMAHEVPLSRQAVALLRRLRTQTGNSPYLFPGRQGARTMSENTMRDALIAMGYKNTHCPHGFRSSASTMLNGARVDVGGRKVRRYETGLIELQQDRDDASTRAIYDRGDCWEDRVELMQYWADMIDRLRSGNSPAQKPRLVAVA